MASWKPAPTRSRDTLRGFGLQVGDHVAILMDNRAEYFEVVWGAMRAGLLISPINSHLAPDEASYIAKDCGAAALFGRSATRPRISCPTSAGTAS